jgi:hypothetical protein
MLSRMERAPSPAQIDFGRKPAPPQRDPAAVQAAPCFQRGVCWSACPPAFAEAVRPAWWRSPGRFRRGGPPSACDSRDTRAAGQRRRRRGSSDSRRNGDIESSELAWGELRPTRPLSRPGPVGHHGLPSSAAGSFKVDCSVLRDGKRGEGRQRQKFQREIGTTGRASATRKALERTNVGGKSISRCRPASLTVLERCATAERFSLSSALHVAANRQPNRRVRRAPDRKRPRHQAAIALLNGSDSAVAPDARKNSARIQPVSRRSRPGFWPATSPTAAPHGRCPASGARGRWGFRARW